MKRSYFRFAVLELLLFTTLLPSRVDAAAAPYKVVYTFGGLNDRSGILWVARDAGIFHKHGIDDRQRAQCAGWACPRWRARIVARDERPRARHRCSEARMRIFELMNVPMGVITGL